MNHQPLTRGDKIQFKVSVLFRSDETRIGFVTSAENEGFVEVWTKYQRASWYKQGNGVLIPAVRNDQGNLEVVLGTWRPTLYDVTHVGRWF